MRSKKEIQAAAQKLRWFLDYAPIPIALMTILFNGSPTQINLGWPWFFIILAFSIKVGAESVPAEQKVFDPRGPYLLVRHPKHLAHLIASVSLLLASKVEPIVILMYLTARVLYTRSRTTREDATHAKRWGHRYERYRHMVPAIYPQLVPWRIPGKNVSGRKIDIKRGLEGAKIFGLSYGLTFAALTLGFFLQSS